MTYELKPAMQIHPTKRNDRGEQEVVYFREMSAEEIAEAEQGAIPKKFDRIEDGKTIFIWMGETPAWSGTPKK